MTIYDVVVQSLLLQSGQPWWYDPTVLVVAIGALVVSIAGAYFAYRALLPPKRRLEIRLVSNERLTTSSSSDLVVPWGQSAQQRVIANDIEIRYRGTVVANPYVATYEFRSTGRHNIASQAFDQGRPINLWPGAQIVADLTIDSPIRYSLTFERLSVGPELLSATYNFRFLLDGWPNPLPKVQHHLIDTLVKSTSFTECRGYFWVWRWRYLTVCTVLLVFISLIASITLLIAGYLQ